ncbi:hypothetical protein [Streptomyces chrestomyceticus]|uniref:hypothetical protein n=1 Tax=Streptomyces chrestomyceticus TaxID=68185 RepID=UPI0035A8C1F0
MKGSVPGTGSLVYDTVQLRLGQVVDHLGAFVQLRPPGGGREWEADPGSLRPLTPCEALSARVAVANHASENGLLR